MKKLLTVLLVFVLALTALCSCKHSGNDKTNNNANADDYFYAFECEMSAIMSKDAEDIMDSLFSDVYAKLGVVPTLKSESSETAKHEIIFGKTSRELSKRAYQLLDRIVTQDEIAGYLIYSDGTSVAVAYSTKDSPFVRQE